MLNGGRAKVFEQQFFSLIDCNLSWTVATTVMVLQLMLLLVLQLMLQLLSELLPLLTRWMQPLKPLLAKGIRCNKSVVSVLGRRRLLLLERHQIMALLFLSTRMVALPSFCWRRNRAAAADDDAAILCLVLTGNSKCLTCRHTTDQSIRDINGNSVVKMRLVYQLFCFCRHFLLYGTL